MLDLSSKNLYIRFGISDSHKMLSAGKFTYKEPRKHSKRLLSHHVILYIEHGEWEISFCGKDFKMKSGDVVFMPANVLHFGKTKCTPNIKGMFLHIAEVSSDGIYNKCLNDNNFLYFSPVVPTNRQESVYQIFSMLVQYSAITTSHKNKICSSLFDSLLLLLSEHSSGNDKSLINVVNEIFYSNNEIFLTNEQIAEKTNFSKKYLEKIFKMQTGKTLRQYQIDKKINQAQNLIISLPEMTITEIAGMLGFYDSAHFSKAFKNQVGVTPSVFKKQTTQRKNSF